MKRRGGYPGNLKHQIKVRVSQEILSKLTQVAEEQDGTVARVVRDFIRVGLESEKNPPRFNQP